MSNGDLPPNRAPTLLHRVLQLVACIVAGSIVGAVGQHYTGSSTWFLAVPALVLVAWFFVADPTECMPPNERPSHDGSGRR